MNLQLQSNIYRVTKGHFVNDKTGEVINYAKVYLLQSVHNTADDVGMEIIPISCDYDKFDELVNFYKSKVQVLVDIELKPNNGFLKPKAVKFTAVK